MAGPYPVYARLVWLADYLTSREGRPDMVNTINREEELLHTVARHVLGQEASDGL